MKAWWKSKTLWFNMLVAFGAAAESQLGLLRPFVGEAGYVTLVMMVPAINVGLRFISTTGLEA